MGISQALALGRHLAAEGALHIDAVVSSDLSRAADTAYAVAAALSGDGSRIPRDAVALHPELRERHMGTLQGMTRKEVSATSGQQQQTSRHGSKLNVLAFETRSLRQR